MKFTNTQTFLDIEQWTSTTLVKNCHRNFRTIFEKLESLDLPYYHLIETGCCRWDQNWKGEGQFTIIADKFLNHYDGRLLSVNINPTDVRAAQNYVSEKCSIVLNDSIAFLQKCPNIDDVNLFYLDSMDLDWNSPHPSAFHHYKEFYEIISRRTKGAFYVCVDDCNIPHNGQLIGKGQLIKNVMSQLKLTPIMDQYQILYVISDQNLEFIKQNLDLVSTSIFEKIE